MPFNCSVIVPSYGFVVIYSMIKDMILMILQMSEDGRCHADREANHILKLLLLQVLLLQDGYHKGGP